MVYDMILPSIPFLAGYFLTYALCKRHFIKKSLHVNLWNFILFSAFLITGIAGFVLMILLELGVITSFNLGLLYWHVELGITMAMVTVFHVHTYWKSTKRTLIGSGRARS